MSKISKKSAKDEIDQFEIIDDFKKEKLANKKIKLTFVGVEKDKMASDNGFSKKQLEQLSQLMDIKISPIQKDINELKSDMKDVKSRLDVLETKVDRIEKDIKDIKSTPTMSRELKQIKK